MNITVTSITQDEPVEGPGNNAAPDAVVVGSNRIQLRAERDGTGNGRVYRIEFVARDSQGFETPGSVEVCVRHDQRTDGGCVDDGQDYDSTQSR